MLYRLFAKPFLFLLPPETAHRWVFFALAVLRLLPGAAGLLRALFGRPPRSLETRALGLVFPSPIGLAAGLDKDAVAFELLGALGFGFVEVGTITAHAQPGSPRPRLHRLPRDRALVNRMGFNNRGAAAAARRLARARRVIVGVNVGKTRATPDEATLDDYRESTRQLAAHADYFVVNVSSPNTPGLRELQAATKLGPLLAAVREELDSACPARRVPLLVKIAPDLADDDIDAIADLALELGLDGIVATNTTLSREGLTTPREVVEAAGAGGLSGPPLRERSLEVLRRLRARVGDRVVLVSVGGIETADDAWQRIRAGATLVQLYTAFVYEGPGLASRMARDLDRLIRAAGHARLEDAVGEGVRASRAV